MEMSYRGGRTGGWFARVVVSRLQAILEFVHARRCPDRERMSATVAAIVPTAAMPNVARRPSTSPSTPPSAAPVS